MWQRIHPPLGEHKNSVRWKLDPPLPKHKDSVWQETIPTLWKTRGISGNFFVAFCVHRGHARDLLVLWPCLPRAGLSLRVDKAVTRGGHTRARCTQKATKQLRQISRVFQRVGTVSCQTGSSCFGKGGCSFYRTEFLCSPRGGCILWHTDSSCLPKDGCSFYRTASFCSPSGAVASSTQNPFAFLEVV